MMSTDLIFSQPIPQNPSTEIQSGRRGPSGMDRSSENQHTHQAPGADGNNFLNTLKQVSQDRGSTKPSAHAGEA